MGLKGPLLEGNRDLVESGPKPGCSLFSHNKRWCCRQSYTICLNLISRTDGALGHESSVCTRKDVMTRNR